ncbi:NAD(P)-binding protein [Agrobacterium vitis]|nr:NAD(P)-binding protein [Agrobacterium vitis]
MKEGALFPIEPTLIMTFPAARHPLFNDRIAMSYSISRRTLLRGMTALAGSFAAPSLITGFSTAQAAYRTSKPNLPIGFGKGKSVAILGAGVAGLTAALTLARSGFSVQVFEADSRYGGRSLTVRPTNEHYKSWWFKNYPGTQEFSEMYVDRYQETADSPAPDLQICQFMDDAWAAKKYAGNPVELYLNAGPGRIPSNHVNLIALCQEIGVSLEPYFFQSMSNLMQSKDFNNGAPVSFAQVTFSLYSEMAAMMYKVTKEGVLLQGDTNAVTREKLKDLYRVFGDLTGTGEIQTTTRLGFSHLPGGWRDAPKTRDAIGLEKILDSGFVGDPTANPELTPGSFLFNSFNTDWQPTLMQPVGGMDRIWQQLLLQDVPTTALWKKGSKPRHPKVGHLVQLKTKASKIASAGEKVVVTYETAGRKAEQAQFDFCISTMAPSLLNTIIGDYPVPPDFRKGLEAFSKTGNWNDKTPNLWTPAIKVGWQGKDRFWETDSEIYGGISWTTDIIGQIWYPSEDFTAHTGVLTGAYNRGPLAVDYAKLNNTQRVETARQGLGLLHPGKTDQVYRGVSIAWQYMPHQVGGWASDTATTDEKAYQQITTFEKNGRFFCAGDTWSYLPGWQEGSVTSAYCAVNAIARTMDPAKYSDCACFQ